MADRREPKSPYELETIDYVMSTLENAFHSGLTLEEVIDLGTFADNVDSWDYAVSLYTS